MIDPQIINRMYLVNYQNPLAERIIWNQSRNWHAFISPPNPIALSDTSDDCFTKMVRLDSANDIAKLKYQEHK